MSNLHTANSGNKTDSYKITGYSFSKRDMPPQESLNGLNFNIGNFFRHKEITTNQDQNSLLATKKGELAEIIFLLWMDLHSESIIRPQLKRICKKRRADRIFSMPYSSTDLLAMTGGKIVNVEVKFLHSNKADSRKTMSSKAIDQLRRTKKILNWLSKQCNDDPLHMAHVVVIFTDQTISNYYQACKIPTSYSGKALFDHFTDRIFKPSKNSSPQQRIFFRTEHLVSMYEELTKKVIERDQNLPNLEEIYKLIKQIPNI